jgi:dienelactone hydrolase
MSEWIAGVSNWTRVSNDLQNTADWLQKTYSTNKIGLVGFCWGGLQVVRACSNLSTLFFTGISIHGSGLTPTEVSQLKQPMLFIAARNDPALRPNISDAIEQANPNISKQCEYKTYPNMNHGFVAASANYSNPDNVAAIDDVHLTIRSYLDKILGINSSSSVSINFNFLLILLFFSVYLYL